MPENSIGNYWEEDPEFPLEDWKYEVANNDTRKGYHEWIAAQKFEG